MLINISQKLPHFTYQDVLCALNYVFNYSTNFLFYIYHCSVASCHLLNGIKYYMFNCTYTYIQLSVYVRMLLKISFVKCLWQKLHFLVVKTQQKLFIQKLLFSRWSIAKSLNYLLSFGENCLITQAKRKNRHEVELLMHILNYIKSVSLDWIE